MAISATALSPDQKINRVLPDPDPAFFMVDSQGGIHSLSKLANAVTGTSKPSTAKTIVSLR